MIRVEMGRRRSETAPRDESYMVLNGQAIEDSWAGLLFGRLDARVHDETAVTLLLECSLSEIVEHFAMLTLPLLEPPSDDFSTVEITCIEYNGNETLRFDFQFTHDVEHWAKLWSIADVASTLKKIVENRGVPKLSFQKDEDTVPGISLRVELYEREETVR